MSLPTRSRPVGGLLRRGAGAGVTAIPPNGVAGLTFWVKSDTETYSDSAGTVPATSTGNPVQRWDSQAGGGWQLNQPVLGSQPSMQLAQINGKPALRYDGTDDYQSSAAFMNFVTDSLYVIYCVYKIVAVDTNVGGTFSNDAAWSDVGGYLGQHLKNDGNLYAYNYAGGDQFVALPYTLGAWMATRQRHVDLGGGLRLYLKRTGGGAEVSIASGATTSVGNVLQTGRGDASNFFLGDLAELFIYNTNVSAGDMAGLEQYITDRYGLAW
jgi:hypothetical protein